MKSILLPLIAFTLFFITSCRKEDKGCWDKKECTFCKDKSYEKGDKGKKDWNKEEAESGVKSAAEGKDKEYGEKDVEKGGCKHEMTEIVVEPLILDESCGCYADGMVKYVKNDQTIALVKYYNEDCDGVATKILCFDGDCESKKATCCQFVQDCGTKEVVAK